MAGSRKSAHGRAQLTERPDPLCDLVRRHRGGEPVGIVSVCSAHPLVLEAAMLEASTTTGDVLVEATSNQVDQTGGYTQMRPPDFRELVLEIAARCGVPATRVILGGDHLGPNRWRELDPETAMSQADELVAAYVAAGFTKIHLDCSMACRGDPQPLPDELVAARSARLMRVAEDTAAAGTTLSYVIGTEVPTPGGATHELTALRPTSPPAAARTLEAHRAALSAHELEAVWPRVRALVVQPGVEFDHLQIIDYERNLTTDLQRVLEDEPDMVFEAHSTDYQTPARLRALVEDHWAVLKVGPALTFALREAMFALAAIEDELVRPSRRSGLLDVIERRMLANPDHWKQHYVGDADTQRLERRYSFSDRIRYYWPDPEVHDAEQRLMENLEATGIPLPVLSQHLPKQYARVREGLIPPEPRPLVSDRVRSVVRTYLDACSAENPRPEGRSWPQ
jgi:D-tagatose-1,6-bisphosphate aldolase subunit GatZ/KbaZ